MILHMKFLKGLDKDTEKNYTHVTKVGHTSEFPFGIYWWSLKKPKSQNFEKTKKNCWRYHHFTHVYQKPQSYEVQFLRYIVRLICFFILGHFLLYTTPTLTALHPNIPENDIFWKMKKSSGDVIILNLCNKKHNKMMYFHSDMECNRQFVAILGYFCSFTPLLTPKMKIWKKCKKHLEILSFYTNAP